MIQQPQNILLVLQFMKDVSPILPHQRKEMGHIASLRQLPILQQGFHGKRFVHIGDTVRQYSVHPLPPSAMPDADRINFQQQPLIKNTEKRTEI